MNGVVDLFVVECVEAFSDSIVELYDGGGALTIALMGTSCPSGLRRVKVASAGSNWATMGWPAVRLRGDWFREAR